MNLGQSDNAMSNLQFGLNMQAVLKERFQDEYSIHNYGLFCFLIACKVKWCSQTNKAINADLGNPEIRCILFIFINMYFLSKS